MPEMYLKRYGFTYSSYWPCTKDKKIIQTFQETGDLRKIYENKLDVGCFRHDMGYGNF